MRSKPLLLLVTAVLCSAMAGGMGWGIRGQYGHQTGAMIAGVLVGLVWALLFLPRASSLQAARAVACCALGVSLGGTMTYGLTLGLTHDAELVGNWQALRWGLLGVFIKGGIWIGFCGLLFAMAVSAVRYRPAELALLLLAATFVSFVGIELFNEPYDPAARVLPKIYFSDHWHWVPEREWKPRRELWGGLLLALVAMTGYVRIGRGDRLALRGALFGALGGGIGFAAGQSLQAWHAWDPDFFRQGWFAAYEPQINWWNMMETSFGAIFAAVLAIGLFLNRHLIADSPPWEDVSLTPAAETALVLLHAAAVAAWSFRDSPLFDRFADLAIPMIIIPLVATSAGRWWPYWVALPIIMLPIAGKTLRQMSYHTETYELWIGWCGLFALPMMITLAAAWYFGRRGELDSSAAFGAPALLLLTWLYFGLNWVFFEYPWPWAEWTNRTPNGILFTICLVGLSGLAVSQWWSAGRRAGTP